MVVPNFSEGRNKDVIDLVVNEVQKIKIEKYLHILEKVSLGTENIQIAKEIAKGLRGPSGRFSTIRAVGIKFPERYGVVVSMNLLDCSKTPMHRAFEYYFRLEGFRKEQIL